MVTLYGSADAEPFQSGYFESKRLFRELSKRHRLVPSFQSGVTRGPDSRLLAAAVQSGGLVQFKARQGVKLQAYTAALPQRYAA